VLGAASCVISPPAIAGADEALVEARAAAEAGNVDRSIALYDEFLAANPGDVEALNRSAQQLSWLRRFDEALSRYERVLVIQPDNYFAMLERAKVLSWARKYEESIAAFEELLELEPADLDARLGLARVLSWSGRLGAAREQYLTILDEHPGHGYALLGVAQTYAWSGDLRQARHFYKLAADALDDPKDAEVGLAYIDLWEGASGRALTRAEELDALHSGDGDVSDLLRAARDATAPWIASSWDRMTDSDDHRISTWRTETGFWVPLGVAARLTYVEYDIRSQQQEGDIRSLQARFDWVPLPEHRLQLMLGTDRWSRPSAPSDSTFDWGFNYSFPVRGTWSGFVGSWREPYRYSVQLIDNRVVIDAYNTGVAGNLPGDWRLATQLGVWNTSDDNRRLSADASMRRQWRIGAHSLESGGNLRWLDWRMETGNGYFDPSNFTALGVPLRAFGPLSEALSVSYDVSLELGLQSFSFAGARTSLDPYYITVARISQQVTPALRLEAFAEAGSYASEGSDDWRYTRGGARFVWQFGRTGE
jgi:thioredoxin-like negative regulator of GroEL